MPTNIDHVSLALIDNFQSEESEIHLTERLSIVRVDKLPPDERQIFSGSESFKRLFRTPNKFGRHFRYITYSTGSGERIERTIERSNHVLRWHFNGEVPDPFKKHYDLMFGATHGFEDVLTALRLLKPAMIGMFPQEDFYHDTPLPPEIKRSTSYPHNGYQLSKPEDVEPYALLSSEIDELRRLVIAIQQIKLPRLITAMARLDNQYTRTYLADRIIDAVVALEALYFDDSVQNELNFRLGVRIAVHLGGSNADKRDHLYTLATTAYNLRSKIVHGSLHSGAEIERFKDLKKGGWSSTEHLLDEVTNLLRQSLRSILLEVTEAQFGNFHAKLDACIRRGETYASTQ